MILPQVKMLKYKIWPHHIYFAHGGKKRNLYARKNIKRKKIKTSTCNDFIPSGKHTFIRKNSQQ